MSILSITNDSLSYYQLPVFIGNDMFEVCTSEIPNGTKSFNTLTPVENSKIYNEDTSIFYNGNYYIKIFNYGGVGDSKVFNTTIGSSVIGYEDGCNY